MSGSNSLVRAPRSGSTLESLPRDSRMIVISSRAVRSPILLRIRPLSGQPARHLAGVAAHLLPRGFETAGGGERVGDGGEHGQADHPADALRDRSVPRALGALGLRGGSVEHVVQYLGDEPGGFLGLFLLDLMGAELQQQGVWIDVLVVVYMIFPIRGKTFSFIKALELTLFVATSVFVYSTRATTDFSRAFRCSGVSAYS